MRLRRPYSCPDLNHSTIVRVYFRFLLTIAHTIICAACQSLSQACAATTASYICWLVSQSPRVATIIMKRTLRVVEYANYLPYFVKLTFIFSIYNLSTSIVLVAKLLRLAVPCSGPLHRFCSSSPSVARLLCVCILLNVLSLVLAQLHPGFVTGGHSLSFTVPMAPRWNTPAFAELASHSSI